MDSKIPADTKNFTFSSFPNSFMHDPITENEIYLQVLQNLLKAAGPEHILIKFFKNIRAYNIHFSEGCI